MQKTKQPFFKLSFLAAAIGACTCAYADESGELAPITVVGNAVPTTVTHNEMAQRVTQDFKQAMKNQVGLAVSGGNGVAQYYSIRGIGEDKIALEVDGTSQSGSILHHQGRFMIDPKLVKVIDVEKGAGSASAGLGALGGVIRVTTVDAKDLLLEDKNVGMRIGATASSNKGFGTDLAAYTNQNGFDFLAAGHFLQNKDYKDGHGNTNYGSKLRQSSYLVKLGYDFNADHNIRLSTRQEYQEGRRSPRIEFIFDPANEKIGESDSAQRQRTHNLEYNGRNLGFISQINANVFRTQIDDYKPPKDVKANSSTSMEITKMYATGANLNLTSDIGTHQLKYGVNYRFEKTKSSDKQSWYKTNVTYKDQKKHEYGVYVEGIWNLEPVILTTGLRYDGFKYYDGQGESVSHGQLNPSISAIYSVTSNLDLIATYNQASRSPRLVEALLASERYTGFRADKNLKAETARRGEFGFNWHKDGFKLSASIFQQNIDDLVVFKNNKKDSTKSIATNDGKIKMHGYEAEASYTYGGLKARLAVSYAKPRVKSDSFKHDAEENPYYFWNIGRQWFTGLSYRFDQPSLEIGWNGRYFEKVHYYGGKPAVYSTKAGFGVHDIFVNWQPLGNDVMNVNVGVNNLFNKYYHSHSQRGNTGYAERGREFVAGINYRF